MEDTAYYRLNPSMFDAVRNAMLRRVAAVSPLILAAIWFFDGHRRPNRDFFDFIGLPLILAFVTYQSIGRERAKWKALVFELRSDRLMRILPDHTPIEVMRNEVTAVVESSKGLVIKTSSRQKNLFVSSGLVDYSEFRDRLSAWVPVTSFVPEKGSIMRVFFRVLFCFVFVLAAFGTPLYLTLATPGRVVIPLSLASFGIVLTMMVYARRSPHFPISLRNRVWFLLVIPLFPLLSFVLHWGL